MSDRTPIAVQDRPGSQAGLVIGDFAWQGHFDWGSFADFVRQKQKTAA
jgi:hypothetical protein